MLLSGVGVEKVTKAVILANSNVYGGLEVNNLRSNFVAEIPGTEFFNSHRRLHSLTCWITPFTTTGFDSTACIISINPGPRLQPVRCSDAEYSLAVRYFGDGVRFIRNRPVG